jgi:hypothetical protein
VALASAPSWHPLGPEVLDQFEELFGEPVVGMVCETMLITGLTKELSFDGEEIWSDLGKLGVRL